MRRFHVVLAVLVLVTGALLFGPRFPGLSDTADIAGATTSTIAGLTEAEREWCEGNPGRVAGVAHWEFQDHDAPVLQETERLTGELHLATADVFAAWSGGHPDLYDQACEGAFNVWAGQ